ncbi:MAG: Bug family tripartite tricarboxylate transporter substrate binding protein [Limnohabitans sp.]
MKRRQFLTTTALATTGMPWAFAQNAAWPQKPIKLIVPYIAGSAPDMLARAMAERLGPALGQAMVIDNRPGASGNIGFDAVAKAPADGYTLGLATSSLGINPFLFRKVPFEVPQEFSLLNLTYGMSHALIVNADAPIKTVGELIRKLKAEPGKYNYSSGGSGTGAHLCAELFKSMAGVEAMHVPYKGAPEIITSVLGGDILFGFPTLATAIPLAKSGKLRILGVSSEKRNPALPEVAAISETVPEFDVVSWFGLVGPARMPPEVVRRIDQEMARITGDSVFKSSMQSKGTDVIGLNNLAFNAFFKKDMQRWKRAVEASGAQVD